MLHVKSVVLEIAPFTVKLVLLDTSRTFKVCVSYVATMIHVKPTSTKCICIKCLSTVYSYTQNSNLICAKKCPDDYIKNDLNKTCEKCFGGCLNCYGTNKTDCSQPIQCSKESYLYDPSTCCPNY